MAERNFLTGVVFFSVMLTLGIVGYLMPKPKKSDEEIQEEAATEGDRDVPITSGGDPWQMLRTRSHYSASRGGAVIIFIAGLLFIALLMIANHRH